MKELAYGTQVSARTYYYLLDFNDRDEWKFIQDNFNKTKLKDLNIREYRQLFDHATKVDAESLNVA